ncbi:sulfite exporter TauE/SafE family protein [Fidelibacter multiformis]|uniref:sulfite exporter TauE/SafE family protein n=1 Tax=Fidelibacter multiformis TaxID=3377529 RepID=UPI0037DC62FE
MFELALEVGLALLGLAFFAELVDSSLGMGYGTTLTPVLLLLGFEPLQVVPAILLSELVSGLLAGFTHHAVGNADFKPKTMSLKRIYRAFKEMGFTKSMKKGLPMNLKVALLIASCSVVGTVSAVLIAVNIPKLWLKLYIGGLVFAIGLIVLLTINKMYAFSWKKVGILGIIASFNKGISGGGYGPVVTSGQLLSGVDGKNAVAITSVAEGLTCLVGVLLYIFTDTNLDWSLAPYLTIGAVLSVYPSAFFVKSIKPKVFKMAIGILTMLLGILTLYKTLIH